MLRDWPFLFGKSSRILSLRVYGKLFKSLFSINRIFKIKINLNMEISLIFYLFGFWSLFLTIFGTICNCLIIYICSKLKDRITFKLLSYMAISDTISLYYWNLGHYFMIFHNYNLTLSNVLFCNIGYFLQVSSLQYSAWALVKKKYIFK